MGLFNMVEGELMGICFYKYTCSLQGILSPGGENNLPRKALKLRKLKDGFVTYRLLLF
jgi:hypothetical protein